MSDLVERGLDPTQGILFVIDGAKALRKAIRAVFGNAPIQRCIRHKERNVLDHMPERDRPRSSDGSAQPGPNQITTKRSTGSARSQASSTAPTPAPPAPCVKASRRRSRSPGSGSKDR